MGTNYYVESDEGYHIGKSSGGWCFSLHVDPDNGISTLKDIRKIWMGKKIINEYGRIITKKDMLSIIKNRSWKKRESPYGYRSWEHFHKKNHSEDGPNGLLRHRIDNEYCIGHGNGTYDYLIGEFC